MNFPLQQHIKSLFLEKITKVQNFNGKILGDKSHFPRRLPEGCPKAARRLKEIIIQVIKGSIMEPLIIYVHFHISKKMKNGKILILNS